MNFIPAKQLRPYDDTLDGYIVHALSYGWFFHSRKLSPVSVLTEDSFDGVIERVQQYQAMLAYAQYTAPERFETILPGTFYALDWESKTLKVISFKAPILIQQNSSLFLQPVLSDCDTFSL